MKKKSRLWSPALSSPTKIFPYACTKSDANSEMKHDRDKVFYVVESSP